MADDLTEAVRVFGNCPAFSEMSEKAIRELAVLATPFDLKKGEFLFREGDPCNFFYVVKKGRVKSFKQSESGKVFITNVSGHNDSIGAVVMFEDNFRLVFAKAMENTTLLSVKRDDYLSWIRRHPSVLIKMTVLHARVMNSAYERLIDMVGASAERRICNILYMLYGKFGGTLNFTCEEIADLAGTTTETAIRMVNKLKKSMVLAPIRGKIHILDQAELKKRSRGTEHVPGRI
jgi:CRP/FNR family transcriptional regulator, nitrogen oxide reductase regulator